MITAIKTTSEYQVIFLDTPGLHESKKPLNKRMQKEARQAAEDADLLVILCDPEQRGEDEEIGITKNLRNMKKPVILAINKIDIIKKAVLLPIIEKWSNAGVDEIYPISAINGEGVEELERCIVAHMPQGPRLFPESMITSHSERFLTSEIIREKIFMFTHQEIPYSTLVEIDEFKERSESLSAVRAIIYVEKDSQKGILIGQNGSMIKKIGQAARMELEKRFDRKFYLDLGVKTKKDWTKNETFLKQFDRTRQG